MRYFASVDLSEIMTISECAEWVAFGRLPSPRPVPGKKGLDARRDFDAIRRADGYRVPVNYNFDAAELDQLLPGVDPDEFRRNLAICGGTEPKTFIADRWDEGPYDRELEEAETEEERSIVERKIQELEAFQKAASWFRDTKEPLDHRLDKARSAVCQALMDGRLVAKGFTPDDGDYDAPDELWSLREIAPDDWVPEDVSWESAGLFRSSGSFDGVTVDTATVLSVFPQPRLKERPLSGHQFGAVVIVGKLDQPRKTALPAKKPRGVSSKASKEQIAALNADFWDRLNSGRLPAYIETAKEDAKVWLQKRYGLAVSADTAGRYIHEILDKIRRTNQQKSGV